MINSVKSILLGFLVFVLIFFTVNMTREKFIFKKTTSEPVLDELIKNLSLIFNRDNYFTGKLSSLNERDIMKELNFYPGNKSYTLNKKDTYICLKDKKTKKYYDMQILLYVALHEIAHSINTENVGHTKEWSDIFEELLEYASDVGVYDPSVDVPLNYCK